MDCIKVKKKGKKENQRTGGQERSGRDLVLEDGRPTRLILAAGSHLDRVYRRGWLYSLFVCMF